MQVIPPEVQRLHALEVLDLDNNKLTALPSEIGTLKSLQVLRADNNQLAGVPCESLSESEGGEGRVCSSTSRAVRISILGPRLPKAGDITLHWH